METSQLSLKELAELADKHLNFAEDNAKAGLVIPAIRNLAEAIKLAELGKFPVPQKKLEQIEQLAYIKGVENLLHIAKGYTLDKMEYDAIDLLPAIMTLDEARRYVSKISLDAERKKLEARIDELESSLRYYVADKV